MRLEAIKAGFRPTESRTEPRSGLRTISHAAASVVSEERMIVVRSGPYASNKIGVGESETTEMAVMRRKVEASRGATDGVFLAAPPRLKVSYE